MFLDFYKLREEPFGVTPDPRYLYLSSTHREALASLVYGVEVGRGFMTLIARPGMGKTTLLFQLLEHFERSARTVFLFQTQSTPRDFLRSLLTDLGVESDDGDVVRMHSKLNEVLLHESRSGKRFVAVIDEAQNLEDSVLEVIRMLSNFETSRDKLMQIILAGQPQLADKLGSVNLVQLRQRISLFAHLDPFDAGETNLYIDHRLGVAGCDFQAPLFTRQARAMIASGSDGIPRNINNICFNALSLGCALRQRTIDRDVILEVLGDLDVRSQAVKSSLVAKAEITKKHKATLVAPIRKSPSAFLGWLPRFALVGAFLAAMSWPLVDAVKNGAPMLNTQNPTAVESASLGLATQVVSETSKANFDAISTSRVVRVKPYDTLYRICADNFRKCSTEIMQKIFELNPWMVNPDSLRPGQELRLPETPKDSGDVEWQIEPPSGASSNEAGRP